MAASSTGLAAGLAESEALSSLTIFSQIGSKLPDGTGWSSVQLIPCWKHDDPISLILALKTLLVQSRHINVFLFNIHLTAFGRRAVTNVTGLLIPPILAILTRKQVLVYMHNFLETQDTTQLGYRLSRLSRWGVQLLERVLLRTTRVVVPLKSQKDTISRVLHIVPYWVPIPFAEPVGMLAAQGNPPTKSSVPLDAPTKILLLGSWGPQKDLAGALEAIIAARALGGQFTLSITGLINAHFPEYQAEVDRAAASIGTEWAQFLGSVPESELLRVILNHDLVILPYNATGGYSGAMSLTAYCGLGVIAYDLPQMRETASLLGVSPTFIAKGDTPSLAREIVAFCSNIRAFRRARRDVPQPEYDLRFGRQISQLVEAMRPQDDLTATIHS